MVWSRRWRSSMPDRSTAGGYDDGEGLYGNQRSDQLRVSGVLQLPGDGGVLRSAEVRRRGEMAADAGRGGAPPRHEAVQLRARAGRSRSAQGHRGAAPRVQVAWRRVRDRTRARAES